MYIYIYFFFKIVNSLLNFLNKPYLKSLIKKKPNRKCFILNHKICKKIVFKTYNIKKSTKERK